MGSTPSTPFVSVIVPVYNGAHILPACLDALADQTYPRDSFEVIVVDNGSTDETRSVVEDYDLRYVQEEDTQSSYAARNAGIRAARGEILAFTDADCVPRADWIAAAVDAFQGPRIGCVAGRIVGAAPQNWVELELSRRNWLSETVTLNHSFLPYGQTANVFYRGSVFESVGGFEEAWLSGGDADLAWRMQIELGWTIAHAPAAVVEHRHRSTLASVFRQSVKWGHGTAQLERRYGAQSLTSDLHSLAATLGFLLLTTAKYAVRTVAAVMKGRPLSRSAQYLIDLASRGGRHAGLLYGRLGRSGHMATGW